MSAATAATAPAESAVALVQRAETSIAVAELEARAPMFRGLLGSDEAVERFNRGVVLAIAKNPDLLLCSPQSILTACMEAAQQGLEPTGAAGGAHLVPFGRGADKVAQLIPDYRGTIRLITRDGVVLGIHADVVKEGDEFRYQLGDDPRVWHTPALDKDRSKRPTTHAYATFNLRGGARVVTVEDRAGIERVMNRGGAKSSGPWATDFDEMAKKTMVKRGAKLCPVDPAIRTLLVREDEMIGQADADPTIIEATRPPSKVAALAARLGASDEAETATDPSVEDGFGSAAAAEEEPPPPLADRLRVWAEENDDKGPASNAQKDDIRALIEVIGAKRFKEIYVEAFGVEAFKDPSAAQAKAVISFASSLADDELVAAFKD